MVCRVSVFIFFIWSEVSLPVLWIPDILVRVRIRIRIGGYILYHLRIRTWILLTDPDPALFVFKDKKSWLSQKTAEVFLTFLLNNERIRILQLRIRIGEAQKTYGSYDFGSGSTTLVSPFALGFSQDAIFEPVMLLERSLPVSMASKLQLCWLTGLVQQWEYFISRLLLTCLSSHVRYSKNNHQQTLVNMS